MLLFKKTNRFKNYPLTKIKLVLFLIVSVIQFAMGQSFSLRGQITEQKTGSPIQGSAVFISHSNFAYTNSEGFYKLSGLNAGKYQFKISSLGYKSVSTEIEINSDEIKDFSLTPSAIELDEVVVSTNRTENYLRNSPFAESLVGKNEI